jgi:hypothetical protein
VVKAEDRQNTATIAGLGITHCSVGGCIAALRVRRVADDKVFIDEALSTATAISRFFGRKVAAKWRSTDEPVMHQRGAGRGTGAGWQAIANGRLAAHALGEDRLISAKIMRTAWHPRGMPDPPSPPVAAAMHDDATCYDVRAAERTLARSMNRARAGRGISKLRFDIHLGRVARKHTLEMIDHREPFHTAPIALGRRITRWSSLGENVGRGLTPRVLHRAFMASPTHRANILNPLFQYVGVGTKRHGGKLWVTVNFERLRDPGTTLNMPGC